jgi:hypothetical protein
MKQLAFIGFALISAVIAYGQNLNRIEYFIDSDPGYGAATSVTFTTSPAVSDVTFDVSISSLADGFHKLFVRARDANNNWSVVQYRPFYKIPTVVVSTSNLNRIEYFIDADPGYGNATSVTFTPGLSVSDLAFAVPVTSLSDGFHKLYIRSRDVNNKWSVVQYRPFYKIPAVVVNTPDLNRIEYFIDTDPGFGAGTDVPFTASANVSDLIFSVDVSALSQGSHKLFIRAHNANNNWSTIQIRDFTLCNADAPVATAATAITPAGFTANWSEVTGSTGYQLDVSTDNFATFVSGYNSKVVSGTSSAVAGLTNGTDYQYRVRANNGCVSISSNNISVSTPLTAPSAPTATAATAITQTGFTANWNAVGAATSYRIDVSADNFTTFVVGFNDQTVGATSIDVIGLTSNVTYKYRVRAVNAGGTSVNSNVVSAKTSSEGQTITFDALPDRNFGDDPITLSATASSGLPVSYASSNPDVATVINNILFLKSAGTATITASQAGNGTTVSAAPVVHQSITVSDANLIASMSSYIPGQPFQVSFKEDVNPVLLGNIHLVDANNQIIETIAPSQADRYSFIDTKNLSFTFNSVLEAGDYSITTDDNFVFTLHHMVVQPANMNFSFATNLGTVAFNPSTQYSAVGQIVYATPADGCGPITNDVVSKIALIDRGTCSFVNKVTNATNAQAVGAILANNVDGQINVAGTPLQSIPSVAILLSDGDVLKSALQASSQYAHIYNKPVRAIAVGSWTFSIDGVARQEQTITFGPIANKKIGDASFAPGATASSSLAVTYTTANPDKITISGSQVTLFKAGRVSITANQPGNEIYKAAAPVSQSFCINPAKPVVTVSNANSAAVTLTSSASTSVQWFLNGSAIEGATNATLSITAAGTYKVQARADDCVSDFSADVPIVVTGDIADQAGNVEVYPNPVEDYLELQNVTDDAKDFVLIDMTGRDMLVYLEKTGKESYRTNVQTLARGLYLLRWHDSISLHQVKVIKK